MLCFSTDYDQTNQFQNSCTNFSYVNKNYETKESFHRLFKNESKIWIVYISHMKQTLYLLFWLVLSRVVQLPRFLSSKEQSQHSFIWSIQKIEMRLKLYIGGLHLRKGNYCNVTWARYLSHNVNIHPRSHILAASLKK